MRSCSILLSLQTRSLPPACPSASRFSSPAHPPTHPTHLLPVHSLAPWYIYRSTSTSSFPECLSALCALAFQHLITACLLVCLSDPDLPGFWPCLWMLDSASAWPLCSLVACLDFDILVFFLSKDSIFTSAYWGVLLGLFCFWTVSISTACLLTSVYFLTLSITTLGVIVY